MPKRYTFVKKIRLLTFCSVNYASTAGGYAAVTKGLMPRLLEAGYNNTETASELLH